MPDFAPCEFVKSLHATEVNSKATGATKKGYSSGIVHCRHEWFRNSVKHMMFGFKRYIQLEKGRFQKRSKCLLYLALSLA